MKNIDYFKLQAKNLFRDYKTKKPYVDDIDGETYYKYTPKYFDIDQIFLDYDWDEEKFSLMNAQHLIANMVGFRKWNDLIKASETELELAKLLFDNQDKISIDEWQDHIGGIAPNNNVVLDDESKLAIFKKTIVNVDGHKSMFSSYRISK